jgi:hypothetical protein
MGQTTSFKAAKNWKLYDITTGNLFRYPVDSLKKFHYIELNDDSIHKYIEDVSELPADDPPRWMGAHIATYEIEGITKKIEISQYGGFFYDEVSKKHYQIPDTRIDEWLAYVRRSFMAIHKESSGQ